MIPGAIEGSFGEYLSNVCFMRFHAIDELCPSSNLAIAVMLRDVAEDSCRTKSHRSANRRGLLETPKRSWCRCEKEVIRNNAVFPLFIEIYDLQPPELNE